MSQLQIIREAESNSIDISLCSISIVTQLSIDRLDRLKYLSENWCNQAIIAAVLDEDRSITDENGYRAGGGKSKNMLSHLEKEVFGCYLKTILVRRSDKGTNSAYPINALRNIALEAATTEFVFLLDVDCVPCANGIQALVGSPEKLNSLRSMCTDQKCAVVVPCFELVYESKDTLTRPALSYNDVMTSYNDSYNNISVEDSGPFMRPFMIDRFARGHQATNFAYLLQLWKKECDTRSSGDDITNNNAPSNICKYYPIQYEEGFEPYVIVTRAYVPPYDERFTGYGRNKAIHLYHLHKLGIQFYVASNVCVIHLPHSPTSDMIRLLGKNETMTNVKNSKYNCNTDTTTDVCKEIGLLDDVKEKYRISRDLIRSQCTSWVFNNSSHSHAVCVGTATAVWRQQNSSIQKFLMNTKINVCDRYSNSDGDESLCTVTSLSHRNEILANICSIHMEYNCPELSIEKLYNVTCHTSEINNTPVWLTTHLSVDRLERLKAQCELWEGLIAAAIWIQPFLSRRERRDAKASIREFVNLINSNKDKVKYKCSKLFVVIAENYYIDGIFGAKHNTDINSCGLCPNMFRNMKYIPKEESILSSTLYPVNALRGAAIDIVCEISEKCCLESLLLVIDVDMRPPLLLCQELTADPFNDNNNKSTQTTILRIIINECLNNNKFVVLPALELCNLQSNRSEYDKQNQISAKDVLNCDSIPNMQTILSTCYANGNVRAFHETTFPSGHRASCIQKWIINSIKDTEDSPDKEVMNVTYEEGWEPYGVMSLKNIMRVGGYNRKFVGWHRDKIEFIRRVNYYGIQFCEIVDCRAFLLDWMPHEPTNDRKMTTQNEYYLAAMEGLYIQSYNQMQSINEKSLEEAWTFTSVTHSQDEYISSSYISPCSFDDLTIYWSIIHESNLNDSDICHGCTNITKKYYWISDERVKIYANKNLLEVMESNTIDGVVSIPMTSNYLTSPYGGVSFIMEPMSQHRIASGEILETLAISYTVRFPNTFIWNSRGYLPGICGNLCNGSASDPIFKARVKWDTSGRAKLNIINSTKTRMSNIFTINVDSEIQFHREYWHSICIICQLNGSVSMQVDGTIVFGAICRNNFEYLQGVQMSIFCLENSGNEANKIELCDIKIAGNLLKR